MPIFEFECQNCEHIWDDWFSSLNTYELPEECPNCKVKGKNKKIPSLCSGRVPLTGQDLVQSIKTESKRLKQEAKTNENLRANLLGESQYNSIISNNEKIKKTYKD